MIRTTRLSTALLMLGVGLLVTPMLVPLQPVAYHETHPRVMGNASEIEQSGLTIVAYENLSSRGQHLYVATLNHDGEYRVPVETAAPDYAYPRPTELDNIQNYTQRRALTHIVIERPPNATLPPADEPVERARHMVDDPGTDETQSGNMTVPELRKQIARYDLMTTRIGPPPLLAPQSLLRLVALLGGCLSLSIGGYLRTTP